MSDESYEAARLRLTREILDEVPIGRRPEVLRLLSAYARVHERGITTRALARFVDDAVRNADPCPPLAMSETNMAELQASLTASTVSAARHEADRMDRVLAVLVRHCGGIEMAYERLARSHTYRGTTVEHALTLGGKTVWTGGWYAHETSLQWREEFADAWPADLAKP